MQENVALAPYTTLGIGGPARFFERVTEREALREAVRWARRQDMPWFILGGGSNLLIADAGFDGLVLHLDIRGQGVALQGETVQLVAGAGEPWDGLVARTVAEGWAGLECLSGIPGRIGATPIQNVGAYGQEVAHTIMAVHAYDTVDDEFRVLARKDCRFRYRDSRFKSDEPGRWVVEAVEYRLRVGGEPTATYADLRRLMAERGISEPTLQQVRNMTIEIRKRKSMVIDAADANSRSVGSFFVNPIIEAERLAAVTECARAMGAVEPPHFPAPEHHVKLSAAWLIEAAGFKKGHVMGRAGLSQNHALAIINRGGATAADVLALVAVIQERVHELFGIMLAPEPVFVGHSS